MSTPRICYWAQLKPTTDIEAKPLCWAIRKLLEKPIIDCFLGQYYKPQIFYHVSQSWRKLWIWVWPEKCTRLVLSGRYLLGQIEKFHFDWEIAKSIWNTKSRKLTLRIPTILIISSSENSVNLKNWCMNCAMVRLSCPYFSVSFLSAQWDCSLFSFSQTLGRSFFRYRHLRTVRLS